MVNPALVPIAVAGSTAPDWLEFMVRLSGNHIQHRGKTHIALVWLLGFIAGFLPGLNWNWVVVAFCYGGLTHCFCDAMTASGIPLTWWSSTRSHVFGGRFITGQPGEYIVGVGTALICAFLLSTIDFSGSGSPFFRRYPTQYEEGLIDLHEWREHRFEVF